jgi:hypothetical protein
VLDVRDEGFAIGTAEAFALRGHAINDVGGPRGLGAGGGDLDDGGAAHERVEQHVLREAVLLALLIFGRNLDHFPVRGGESHLLGDLHFLLPPAEALLAQAAEVAQGENTVVLLDQRVAVYDVHDHDDQVDDHHDRVADGEHRHQDPHQGGRNPGAQENQVPQHAVRVDGGGVLVHPLRKHGPDGEHQHQRAQLDRVDVQVARRKLGQQDQGSRYHPNSSNDEWRIAHSENRPAAVALNSLFAIHDSPMPECQRGDP